MTHQWSFFVSIIIIVATTSCNADIITTPLDLNPGDQYRLVFVTSQSTPTTSTDIAFYNNFVNGVANGAGSQLAGLNATWTAIASTNAVDARDNTNTNPNVTAGVPIYLVDGNRVADNNADLWDGTSLFDPDILQSMINRTEIDTVPTGAAQLTGTGTWYDGTVHPTSGLGLDGNNPSDFRAQGFTSYDIGGWIYSTDHVGNATPIAMYGISELLTVNGAAVPEPSSFLVFCAGLTSLGLFRLRRQTQKSNSTTK